MFRVATDDELSRSFRVSEGDSPQVVFSELGRVFRSLNTHFEYLSAVQLDLERERRGVKIHYGLDFSDVYTYMHPFQRDTRQTRLVEF